jgi:LPXTG-motif cell wall-anchored protein
MVLLAWAGGELYGEAGASAGVLAGIVIGGSLGFYFIRRNKKRMEARTYDLRGSTVEQILKADQKNFEMPFSEISSINVDQVRMASKGTGVVRLMIDGAHSLTLDVADGRAVEEIKLMVSLFFTRKKEGQPQGGAFSPL